MLPDPVLEIAQITRGTPFENDLYLVGGAVRDPLLGLPAGGDFDLVTTHDALDLAELLWQAGLSSIPPVTYPRFGTAMLVIQGANIELVTARAESYDESSRKPTVTPASLLEDALRRDFTVNALMIQIHDGTLCDLLGTGQRDLHDRVLRTPRPPDETFIDDPLRMLRAVRFRWKLGFTPAPGLWESIRQNRERLGIISFERIRDELLKMLLHPTAADALDDLMKVGLMELIASEFLPMVGCEQGKWHHLDVWDHTLLVLRNLPSDAPLELRLAALFHDVAKPATRTIDPNGDIRFFGHETEGEAMTIKILSRWKFPTATIHRVASLVRGHMRLGSMEKFTATAARRLVRDFDADLPLLLDLVEADASALRPGVRMLDLSPIRERIEQVAIATPAAVIQAPLTGEQIMAILKVPAGRVVGAAKRDLEELIITGEIQPGDADSASRWLRENADRFRPPEGNG
jgi:poly(A) polymerase